MRRIVIAAAAALWAAAAAAQLCPEIRFSPGASSGEFSSRVIAGQPQCFSFPTGLGQTARVQILGSDNACFTVDGLADCRDDLSFLTTEGRYTFRVFQLFDRPAWETYTLRLSIH